MIASEMSVIIPGSRSRISRAAPWRNTHPPYANAAVPNTAGMYVEPGKRGAV